MMDCGQYWTVVPAPGGKFRAAFCSFRHRADGAWGVRPRYVTQRIGGERRVGNVYATYPEAMAAAKRHAARSGLRAYPQGTPPCKAQWAA